MKLLAAKTIYWLGIVLLVVALVACFGAIIWGFLSWFPPEHLIAMAIIVGGFAVLIGFGLLFNWAEKVLEENGKRP